MGFYKNRFAVITGAANGLGKALAETLHRQGCRLALIDRDEQGLHALKSSLNEKGTQVSTHCLDIADETKITGARKEILAKHSGIDILINNAGISISQRFVELDLRDFHQLMAVNFWGTICCCKHFLPDLMSRPESRLVNICSNFALVGFPGKTAYGASKGALVGFSNSLKTELQSDNPKVLIVIPPPMDTGLVRKSKHRSPETRALEVAYLKKHGMPLEKVAEVILRKVERGQFRIAVGYRMFWMDWGARMFPTWIHRIIQRSTAAQQMA